MYFLSFISDLKWLRGEIEEGTSDVPQGIDPTIADASTDKITSSVVRQLSHIPRA